MHNIVGRNVFSRLVMKEGRLVCIDSVSARFIDYNVD